MEVSQIKTDIDYLKKDIHSLLKRFYEKHEEVYLDIQINTITQDALRKDGDPLFIGHRVYIKPNIK